MSQEVIMEDSSTEGKDQTMVSMESVPSLEAVSESEDSSCDSMSSAFHATKDAPAKPLGKKRVSWDRVHTREYALVVGDHPFCQDGLPVSLDWQFRDNLEKTAAITPQLEMKERSTSYIFPKRLSYEERRQRLHQVSGLTPDQVKNDEIDLVVRTLQESWDEVPIEPTPVQPCVLPEPDMMIWDDIISQDIDLDLGDISNFEWTD